ncbi:hypothetical protein NDU88_004439 [Pleurodeles waltl]|uniref:Uncharacterized protein n=1 Tax=Pleurodeles waltl TaxID=8319 RepID=A0AAV7NJS6_PLEWA|nr:hypothetical protein NDU88_004439 [Pleurodeles waltl]
MLLRTYAFLVGEGVQSKPEETTYLTTTESDQKPLIVCGYVRAVVLIWRLQVEVLHNEPFGTEVGVQTVYYFSEKEGTHSSWATEWYAGCASTTPKQPVRSDFSFIIFDMGGSCTSWKLLEGGGLGALNFEMYVMATQLQRGNVVAGKEGDLDRVQCFTMARDG